MQPSLRQDERPASCPGEIVVVVVVVVVVLDDGLLEAAALHSHMPKLSRENHGNSYGL